jgi:hypothetical protein
LLRAGPISGSTGTTLLVWLSVAIVDARGNVASRRLPAHAPGSTRHSSVRTPFDGDFDVVVACFDRMRHGRRGSSRSSEASAGCQTNDSPSKRSDRTTTVRCTTTVRRRRTLASICGSSSSESPGDPTLATPGPTSTGLLGTLEKV